MPLNVRSISVDHEHLLPRCGQHVLAECLSYLWIAVDTLTLVQVQGDGELIRLLLLQPTASLLTPAALPNALL